MCSLCFRTLRNFFLVFQYCFLDETGTHNADSSEKHNQWEHILGRPKLSGVANSLESGFRRLILVERTNFCHFFANLLNCNSLNQLFVLVVSYICRLLHICSLCSLYVLRSLVLYRLLILSHRKICRLAASLLTTHRIQTFNHLKLDGTC